MLEWHKTSESHRSLQWLNQTYFLMAVLTLGLAVLRSGLAERVARFFLRRCAGCPRALYLQLLLSFPVLTLLLPSAYLTQIPVLPAHA